MTVQQTKSVNEIGFPKFGIQFRNFPKITADSLFDKIAEVSHEAERAGYDSLWTIDHLMLCPPISYESQPIPDAWTALVQIANETTSVDIGTLVTSSLFRSAEYLAKLSEALYLISSGRLQVGIGAGWFEQEFRAYGIPFPSPMQRLAMVENQVKYLRKYFRSLGQDLTKDGMPLASSPPIWIGGSGPRLTLKLAAKIADACNLFGNPKTVQERLELLELYCRKFSRDPKEIIKSKHSNVVIGRSKAEVEKKFAEIVPERSKWKEFSTSNIVGTASECVESLRKYILVGVEYFTLNFPDLFEIDPLKLFMTDVVGALKEMEISASGEQM